MSDCKCQESNVVPDFTKGFGGNQAVELAQNTTATNTVAALHQQLAAQGVLALNVSACVSASYANSQVCFNFPIVGHICFHIPIPIPVSAELKVCGTVCTKFGVIPEGLKITLYVNGSAAWSGVVWGSC